MRKANLKQVLALILTLTLILTAIPLTAVTAFADAGYETTKVGDYYIYETTGGVGIDKYEGKAAALAIPSKLNGYAVVEIGWGAFENCTSLTSVTVPDSVNYISGSGAFSGCTALTAINVSSGNSTYCSVNGVVFSKDKTELVCYPVGKSGAYTIPSGVKSIGNYAFENCTSLTSVTIPSSVTIIYDSAFEDCTSLTSITIPDSVTSIGSSAFRDTAYYNNKANWENGVLYIGNHLIEADSSTVSGSYQIKKGTKTIAEYSFSWCEKLTSVTIPSGVISIGAWAFYGCSSLTSITIPDSVTSIGDCVFNDTAYYDNEDNWENGVLYIGNHLIEAKWNIASGSYQIKKGTKAIADDAFRSCENLTGITIPSGVTSIGDSAFEDCTSLKSVAIPSSVKSVGECAFEHCSSLTGITIGNGVTSIGSWAFYGCPSVTSVTIPSSVTEIGYKAFGYSLNYDTWNIERVAGFTISCDKGSEAQSYARSNGFKFVDLQTGASTLPGDVNGDGKVSAVDARWALQCAAKKRDLTAEQAAAADVNGDGKISAVDARQILKFAAGKI